MGSLSDSVMNWGQLFAMKQRMDAADRAQAEADATKRFLAEQAGLIRPGDQADLSALPDSSILDRQYQYKLQNDNAAKQREQRRQNLQAAVDTLHQRGQLKLVLDDNLFKEAADLGVNIPQNGLPDRFRPVDPQSLSQAGAGFDEPVPAYLMNPNLYENQGEALSAIRDYGRTVAKRPPARPEFTIQQLEQIPGFATMPEEQKAAMRASVAALGKAPSEDAWRGAMVPKPDKQIEHLTPEMIDALEQSKQITREEAGMLRAVGGDMQLARESIRSRWDGRLPNAAKTKQFELDIDAAKEDLVRATEARKTAMLDDEKKAADAQVTTAQAALKDARTKYKAFLEKQASGAPNQNGDVRSQMVDLATQMRDMGMNEEAIKAQLRKRFGKGQQ